MESKKNLAHLIAGGVALVVLIAFLMVGKGLLGELRELRHEVERLNDDVSNRFSVMDGDMGRRFSNLDDRLAVEASLFSKVETSLGVDDGQLTLDLTAVPKAWTAGDRLSLLVDGVSYAVETKDFVRFHASVKLPPRAVLKPVLVIHSGDSSRQEVLEPLDSGTLLALGFHAGWVGEGPMTLRILLPDAQKYGSATLEQAIFTLTLSDETGTTVARIPVHFDSFYKEMPCATVDLRQYDSEGGVFEANLEAELGGLHFASPSTFASFSNLNHKDGNQSGRHSAGGELRVVFE